MKDRPLVYPILFHPPNLSQDPSSSTPSIPVKPTHLATWQDSSQASTSQSTSDGFTSTFYALASESNSIWILEERAQAAIPTADDEAASSPPMASPSSPQTFSSLGQSSPSKRSRAASSASSTPTNHTARIKVSAFSPPPPVICVTTSPALEGASTFARTDREELLDTLREQKGRDSLSLSGRARDSHESARRGAPDKSPRLSFSQSRLDSPIAVPDARPPELKETKRDGSKKSQAELREDIEERAVDAEMEREERADEQESEDRQKVLEAGAAHAHHEHSHPRTPSAVSRFAAPTQIILPCPGRGSIVALVKVPSVDALVVLRSSGDLDFLSSRSGRPRAHVDVSELDESPRPSGSSTFAALRKQRIRLREPLDWQGVQVLVEDAKTTLFVHAKPCPNLFTQSADGMTTVLILSVSNEGSEVKVTGRVELPGLGTIACGRTKLSEPFLLHSTETSLMTYPIIFHSAVTPLPLPNSPALHKARSIGNFHSLLPASAKSNVKLDSEDDASRPLMTRRSSHSAPNGDDEPAEAPSRFDAFSDSLGGKSLSKLLASRKLGKEDGKQTKQDDAGVTLGEGVEVERDGGGGWLCMRLTGDGEGVGWTKDSFDLFEINSTALTVVGNCHVAQDIVDVRRRGRAVYVAHATSAAVYVPLDSLDQSSSIGKRRRREYAVDQTLCTRNTAIDLDERRLCFVDDAETLVESRSAGMRRPIAQGLLESASNSGGCVILQDRNETTYFFDENGATSRRSFLNFCAGGQTQSLEEGDRLPSKVTAVAVCASTGENPTVLAAGDEDGIVRVWHADTVALLGSWTVFATTVIAIVSLETAAAGPLRGCLLCVAEDGTMAVISVTNVDLLHTIPGSRASLHRVFIGGRNILVTYTNCKARVWNMETGEFRRSTGFDAAEEMINEGQWEEIQLSSASGQASGDTALSSLRYPLPFGSDAARLLHLDLRQFGRRLQYNSSTSTSSLALLRSLLSIFLTFGLDPCTDAACTDGLQVPRSDRTVAVGEVSSAVGVISTVDSRSVWTQSPSATAGRQLAIVSMLRPFLEDQKCERWAAEAIAFYVTSLAEIVGPGFQEPPLSFFADHYLDASADVHQAARMLFGGRLGRMSESEIEDLVEKSRGQLPVNQKVSVRQSVQAAAALTVVGGVALERFTSMSPSVLKETAASISLYLHDDKSPHKALAIEMCSKGFQTWQSYTDAMDLLRRLFHLATRKEPQGSSSTSGSGVAAQSRIAVLHIAESNTPLFMTTLSMDILDARSVEHRTSIMKLCVFMARKRPEILEHGLPRIAEAVVKSLDPNVASMREEVWHAATVILNELVLAFPAIDFFSGTQKLAVGTHEGAVIMYELKTASRLYVLEPHAHPVSAVAFSTDGRRLITVCLEEGVVTVWKIGSSLSGFFTVGGPPRQGGATGQPFKRYEFTRIDNGPLDAIAALKVMKISWPALRTVKIEIQETAMTFAT